MKIRYRKYLLIAILLLFVVIFLLPIRVPFSFRTTAIVYPVKKWSLKTDLDGNFVGELKNYRTGVIEDLISYKFERGDIAKLQLKPTLENNSFVRLGDTIGLIKSQFLDEKIQELKNSIEVETKLLASGKTGEKQEIIENLRQKMVNADVNFGFARKNYERAQILIKDSVIADTEYEVIENLYYNALSQVELTRSDYQVAITGLKPEEISLIEERISSFKRELELSRRLKQDYTLTAPFSGKVIFDLYNINLNPLDYLSISDTTFFLLYAPVKFNYRPYLDNNVKVEFTIPGTDLILNARIYEISNNVELLPNGLNTVSTTQVVFVFAEITDISNLVFPGLTVQCKFKCEEILLREYPRRSMRIFMN